MAGRNGSPSALFRASAIAEGKGITRLEGHGEADRFLGALEEFGSPEQSAPTVGTTGRKGINQGEYPI
jgi:hypothetical protein